MANTTPRWLPMDGQFTVTGTGLPLTVSFAPAPEGMLGIRALSGSSFPGGKLLLFASSRSQTEHWVQKAQVENGVLLASMEGFQDAAASSADMDWILSLGEQTERGLIRHRFQRRSLRKGMERRNRYFHDDRELTVPPPCRFPRDGQEWEVYPMQRGRGGRLFLQVAPVEKRYHRAVACALAGLERDEGRLRLTVRCPETLPRPIGLSILAGEPTGADSDVFAPAEPVGDFDETHTVAGVLDLSRLEPRPGLWQLTCVLGREGDTLLHIPLYISDFTVATALTEELEGQPVCACGEGVSCYLSIDLRHRPLLCWSELQAGGELLPPDFSLDRLAGRLRGVQRNSSIPSCSAGHLGGEDWRWSLRLPSRDFSGADQLALLLIQEKNNEHLLCPAVSRAPDGAGCDLVFDMSPLKETVENCRRVNWQVQILARTGRALYILPLADPGRTPPRNRRPRSKFNFADGFEAPVGSMPFGEHAVELTPYATYKGEWRLMVADRCLRYYPYFNCRAVSAGIRFGRLRLKVNCPEVEGGRWVGVVLSHRYQLESDRAEHFCPLDRLTKEGDHYVLTANIDLRRLTFIPLYWDVRVVFEKDGARYWSSVKVPLHAQKKRHLSEMAWEVGIKGLFFANSVRLNRDHQIFFYHTVGDRLALVCQEYSPYTGFRFRLKERLAMVIYYLFRKRLLKKSIYLTYEKYCCMAQDNGFYFFQYCMEHDMERAMNRNIYYVIDKSQPDYKNLVPYEDHVIPFMSLKHMVYILAARLLISSDSKAHSYAWRAKESVILPQITKKKRLVFLQHGVIALKRVEFYRSGTNSVNLFVTSNDQEHDIIIQELGYLPEEVIITGLARWDVLKDRSDTMPNTHILVMPTWRNWLEEVSDETFMASDYYRDYMALLNSQWLADYLERYDVYLDFYIHPKFREYIKNFTISGERVKLIPFGTEPLNQLMMECKLLVTDYSSVCWDVYYQGKPVIFYQFDVDRYNETQGAYIDLEKDLFGDRATTPEQLFALLEEAAQNGFRLKPEYAEMRESMYKYLDHNNSQRTCDEIMKRNW